MNSKNSAYLECLLRSGDLLLIQLSGTLAAIFQSSSRPDEIAPVYTIVIHFCTGLAFVTFKNLGIYEPWRGRSVSEHVLRLVMTFSMVISAGWLFGLLIKSVGELSLPWVVTWFFAGLCFLLTLRIAVYALLHCMHKRGIATKNVMIIGYGAIGREMHRRAQLQTWAGYGIRTVYDDHYGNLSGIPPDVVTLKKPDQILRSISKFRIHEIWITLPLADSYEVKKYQHLLRNQLLDIRWIPDVLSFQPFSGNTSFFLGQPAVDINRPLATGKEAFAKAVFDKVTAVTALVLLAPLFIVISVSIKCTSAGPVIFTQPRTGLNGKRFNVYKFRTMKIHEENGSVTQACRNDPRLTPLGGFLRRTSLDEIPQFFNVLRGDMSVVGPRPHAIPHDEMYSKLVDRYMLRQRVKPGITGWAQINGYRGETDTLEKMRKRVDFDLDYINHWTIWMDIQIVLWTAFRGWTGRNAY